MLSNDRHNVTYAYGPLNAWGLALAANGFSEVPDIRLPSRTHITTTRASIGRRPAHELLGLAPYAVEEVRWRV